MFGFKLNVCLSFLIVFFLHKVQHCDGIIGGSDAEPGEVEYVVSLRNETYKHYCGGALVTSKHVLTAAHCLFTDRSRFDFFGLEEMYNPRDIKAIIGSTNDGWMDGEASLAEELWPHYRFNITNRDSILYDIGLIKLNRRIDIAKYVPIRLPLDEITYHANATVIGLGVDNRDDAINHLHKTARILQKANITCMKSRDCVHGYLQDFPELAPKAEAIFTTSAFCCQHPHVKTCHRDDGSPLIQDHTIVGVVTYVTDDCQEGSPDIFTSTFSHFRFITDCIQGACYEVIDVDEKLDDYQRLVNAMKPKEL